MTKIGSISILGSIILQIDHRDPTGLCYMNLKIIEMVPNYLYNVAEVQY